MLAARKLRAKLVKIAGHLLEASADDIALKDGVATVAGTDRALPIATVARAAYHQVHRFGGASVRDWPRAEPMIRRNVFKRLPRRHRRGRYRDRRGGLKIWSRRDAGRLINPMIVDGQIHGGVAQGIANALLEEIVYDETGNILTTSLADYLPPTAREIPPIEIHHLETLTEASITKTKGLGEGGTIGAPAAVVNAINDALSPFGVSIDEFPATPQRIRAALKAAEKRT